VRRARSREQFGRPLIDNQAIAFGLARLAVRLDAVTALVAELAGQLDDGVVDHGLIAGVLAEAGTLALAASREGVQVHGAFGMTDDSPIRRHYLGAPLAVAADADPATLYAEAAG
jgi:alkylation response protein AidB-like acyl-CoA dehydrogenase